MFRGVHQITLDAKRRLSVPAKLRAFFETESEGKMLITIDLSPHRNLLVYTVPEWNRVQADLKAKLGSSARERQVFDLLTDNMSELELDGTGRVLLPDYLCKFANLDKKVTLVGKINKLSLWDTEAWEAKRERDIAELLSGDVDLGEILGGLSL